MKCLLVSASVYLVEIKAICRFVASIWVTEIEETGTCAD